MPRHSLRYGHKIVLFAQDGYLVSTNSALAPLGIRPDSEGDDLIPFERAVFTLQPGEGEFLPSSVGNSNGGDEIKFGHVVRLVHNTRQAPVAHFANEHAVVEKSGQRVAMSTTRIFDPLAVSDKWRILPRYKVRGEGERVCEGDHIIFQSTLTANFFLSVSSVKDSRTDNCYELQCSHLATGLEVRVYDAQEYTQDQAIRGGHCVILLHREENRRLLVTNSLHHLVSSSKDQPSSLNDVMVNRVVLDEKLVMYSDPLAQKTSNYGNLFILEFADRSKAGVVQTANKQMYRLKSLCSNSYVCIDRSAPDKVPVVGLTTNIDHEGTLFVFHPAGDDRDEILLNGSRVFIEAPLSSSGDGSQWITSGSMLLDDKGIASPKLMGLVCQRQLSVSDGFEVQRLPFEEYRELSVILSLLPPLQQFITHIQSASLDAGVVAHVTGNIRQLRRMCFRDSVESDMIDAENEVDGVLDLTSQQRLFKQGVTQLAISIVQHLLSSTWLDRSLLYSTDDVALFSRGSNKSTPRGDQQQEQQQPSNMNGQDNVLRYSDVLDIISLSLSLVQCIVRDNLLASAELVHLLPYLVDISRCVPAAYQCVAEFLRSNISLVEELADAGNKDLISFLDLLDTKGRDGPLMQLVSHFAACRDHGFLDGQRIITDRLLIDETVRGRLFLRFVAPKTDSTGALTTTTSGYIEVPEDHLSSKRRAALEPAPSSSNSNPSASGKQPVASEKRYLVPIEQLEAVSNEARKKGKPSLIPVVAHQMNLLASLCAGRSSYAIEHISKVIHPGLLADLVVNEKVPPLLRSRFVTLFTNTAIRTQGAPSIRNQLSTIRVVIDDPNDATFVFERPILDGDIVDVKRYTIDYLVAGSGCMSSDDGKREELDSFVRLAAALLDRGFLDSTEYPKVVFAITAFLDRRNDAASNDPEVFMDKVTIISLLDLFLDVMIGQAAAKMVNFFVEKRQEVNDSHVLEKSDVAEVSAFISKVAASDNNPLRQIAQFIDIQASSRFGACAQELQRYLTIDGHTFPGRLRFVDGASKQAAVTPEEPFYNVWYVSDVLMDIALANSWPLRSNTIRFYCRFANFHDELREMLQRTQVATQDTNESYQVAKEVQAILKEYSVTRKRASRVTEKINALIQQITRVLPTVSGALAPVGRRRSVATASSAAGGGGQGSSNTEVREHLMMTYKHLLLPQMLIQLLCDMELISQRTSDNGLHGLSEAALVALEGLARCDNEVRESIAKTMSSMVFHAVPSPHKFVALSRTVYVDSACVFHLNGSVVQELVRLLGIQMSELLQLSTSPLPPSSSVGRVDGLESIVDLLRDLLMMRDASRSYITRNQSLIWKHILDDKRALALFKLNGIWTGRKGALIRDALLGQHDSASKIAVDAHLQLVDIIFLIAKQNDLVKAEELRYELFSSNGIDDMLEVISNKAVPDYFRLAYINLLQVLVIDDPTSVAALFSHKKLQDFVSICVDDIQRAAQLSESNHTKEEGDDEGPVEQAPHHPTASVAIEQSESMAFATFENCDAGSRRGLAFHVELIATAILPCVRHLLTKYQIGSVRLNPKVRVSLSNALNDIVDTAWSLASLLFDVDTGTDQVFEVKPSVFSNLLQSIASTSEGSTERANALAVVAKKKFRDFFRTAHLCDFPGAGGNTADIERISKLVEQAEVNAVSGRGREADLDDFAESKRHNNSSANFVRAASVLKKSSEGPPTLAHMWGEFVAATFAQCWDARDAYASAAGAILRTGGTPCIDFIKILISSLPHLSPSVVKRVLCVLRQVVELDDNHPSDSSQLLPFQVSSNNDWAQLSLSKSSDERRTIIATFDESRPSMQVLPLVTDLVSSEDIEVRHAALDCSKTLLMGGHRKMQDVLFDSVRERGDEYIFIFLRNQLAEMREAFVTYLKVVRKGSDARDTLSLLDECLVELRFIQLLCEGHYALLQDYLRVQPLNIISVNVIESMSDVLEVCIKVVDDRTIDFLNQLLQTICETIQGPCRENQSFYVTASIPEKLVRLVTEDASVLIVNQRARDMPSVQEKLFEVRLRALDCLLALIEGRTDRYYLSSLLSSIELAQLVKAMDHVADEYEKKNGMLGDSDEELWSRVKFWMRQYVHPTKASNEINDELSLAVNIFIFIKSFLDHQVIHQGDEATVAIEFVDRRNMTIKQVLRASTSFRAVHRKVGVVEILRKGVVEKCYFRILDTSRLNLKDSSRDELIKVVDRSSDNKRLQNFLELAEQLLSEVDFFADLRAVPFVSLLQDMDWYLDNLSLLLAFAINLIMLSKVQAPQNPFDDPISSSTQQVIRGFGLALIAANGLLMFNFLVGSARVYVQSCWMDWVNAKNQEAVDESRAHLSIEPPLVDPNLLRDLGNVKYALRSLWFLAWNGTFLLRCLFLACPILGVLHTGIWYTIPLLHIINKSPLLYNVLLAVSTNGSSLLLTLVLLLFVIYIFSAIAFYNFSELYDPNKINSGYDCETLASCWYTHIDAIRAGGGIGDVTSNPYFDSSNAIGFSFALFKLLFFVIVIIIFLNIVFGIIVDSFAQLREDRDSVEKDQQSKCFICGIEQNEFDRLTAGGFEQHVREEHNMWHYLFFLHNLSKKDVVDMNGQEEEVFKKAISKDPSFFPVAQAMSLSQSTEKGASDNSSSTSQSAGPEGSVDGATLATIMRAIQRLEDRLNAISK